MMIFVNYFVEYCHYSSSSSLIGNLYWIEFNFSSKILEFSFFFPKKKLPLLSISISWGNNIISVVLIASMITQDQYIVNNDEIIIFFQWCWLWKKNKLWWWWWWYKKRWVLYVVVFVFWMIMMETNQ